MAKKEEKEQEMTSVFVLSKEDGWFVLNEIEIPKDLIIKNGKIISKSEPDIFPIFIEHLIKAAKKFYGI